MNFESLCATGCWFPLNVHSKWGAAVSKLLAVDSPWCVFQCPLSRPQSRQHLHHPVLENKIREHHLFLCSVLWWVSKGPGRVSRGESVKAPVARYPSRGITLVNTPFFYSLTAQLCETFGAEQETWARCHNGMLWLREQITRHSGTNNIGPLL